MEEPNPEPVVQSRTEREAIPLATDVVVEDDRFNELFNTTDPSDLAAKFATGRINSIDSAMGINQRLLTVNELFGGDMQSFNASIAKLNGYE